MASKIFVLTHKKFLEPDNPVYLPLHVGREGKQDLGYMGDDTGDTISGWNCYFGELTGMYWIWKNYKGTENIGVCHYRRFFINDKMQMLTEEDYDRILTEYDVITSKAMYTEEPYEEVYGKAHNARDLEETGNVIKELYPEDYSVFCQVMQGTKNYFGNLMVTSRELFDDYCAWLFPIFFRLSEIIDVESYDEYNRRVFGFLSEQLLLVWITARGLKPYECPVGVTGEKAETRELKLAVGQLLKLKKPAEAVNLFYEVLKVRPDISLMNSDLSSEIPLIEQILNVCVEEEKHGQAGFLGYTDELKQLIEHYRKLLAVLEKSEWTKEERDYLLGTGVTDTAVLVMSEVNQNLQHNKLQIRADFEKLKEEQGA